MADGNQPPFNPLSPPNPPTGGPKLIHGVVKDAAGKPLKGVRGVITDVRGVRIPFLTNEIGAFEVRAPLGTYDVFFYAPAHTFPSLRGVSVGVEGKNLGEVTGMGVDAKVAREGLHARREEKNLPAGRQEAKEEREKEEEKAPEEEREERKEEEKEQVAEQREERKRNVLQRTYQRAKARFRQTYERAEGRFPQLRQTVTPRISRTYQFLRKQPVVRETAARLGSTTRRGARLAISAVRTTASSMIRGVATGARLAGLAAQGISAAGSTIAAVATSEVWGPILIIGGVIVAVIIIAFIMIMTTFKPEKPKQQYETGKYTVVATGDIKQCTFYGKSGGLQVGNPNLASLVEQISNKIYGVPPVVVLGVLRIESPSAFTNTNQQYLDNDYDATTSSAGAIGLMQFMPNTFKGAFYSNTSEMQIKFGKTSVQEYIVPPQSPPPNDSVLRITSIKDSITAAAFHIRNVKDAKYGSATPWTEDAVRYVAGVYHGGSYPAGCPYPNGGSYCDDLAKTYTNCQPTVIAAVQGQPASAPLPSSCPAYPADIVSEVRNKFGITLLNFNYPTSPTSLQWIWCKLHENLDTTRFADLVRGVTVISQGATGRGSEVDAASCSVKFVEYVWQGSEAYFKFVFTHELGHTIRWCRPKEQSKFSEYLTAYGTEGAVSCYASQPPACRATYDGASANEGYADFSAYYLNPSAGQSACGSPACPKNEPNPYFYGVAPKKPLHYNVAKSMLEK